MLKMRTIKGETIILNNGSETPFELSEAWAHIYYQAFIAIINNKRIGYRNPTLYPVKSLVPPTKRKVVKVFVLEPEEVR